VKLISAATLATVLFLVVHFGGGSGGLGFGPGLGGVPGKGAGQGGTDDVAQDGKKPTSDDKAKPADKPPAPVTRKPIDIEVLGGDRYPGEDRYYLLKATNKAMTLGEIDAYFKENADRIELHVIITDDSVAKGVGIREDLIDRANRHGIPSLIRGPNEKR
jgi:hypothetical protein